MPCSLIGAFAIGRRNAQAFPSRNRDLVVPSRRRDGTDVVARPWGCRSSTLGQAVVIENSWARAERSRRNLRRPGEHRRIHRSSFTTTAWPRPPAFIASSRNNPLTDSNIIGQGEDRADGPSRAPGFTGEQSRESR